MAKTRVLITVKTYPALSTKYDELVCTAGFREDGSWIRIYPIPFRKLDFDSQYRKYEWIELDVSKNSKDPRPESFAPKNVEDIQIGAFVGTDDGTWETRKSIVLKNGFYTSFDQLLADSKRDSKFTSLAVFQPSEILGFTSEPVDSNWDQSLLADLEAKDSQLGLFKKSENPFKVVRKLPWKFSYRFKDSSGKARSLMIEDWEIGQLYWNCLERSNGDASKAVEAVRKKYFEEFSQKKDLYFFLGTTLEFHLKNAPNPFIIIGAFYPKKVTQLSFPL